MPLGRPITYFQENSPRGTTEKGRHQQDGGDATGVAKLGKDAPLADVLDALKKDFGITLSRAMACTYKSAATKQVGKKRRGRNPGRRKAAVSANGRKAGRIRLEDIQAVEALTDRLGADKVQQLAAVLA